MEWQVLIVRVRTDRKRWAKCRLPAHGHARVAFLGAQTPARRRPLFRRKRTPTGPAGESAQGSTPAGGQPGRYRRPGAVGLESVYGRVLQSFLVDGTPSPGGPSSPVLERNFASPPLSPRAGPAGSPRSSTPHSAKSWPCFRSPPGLTRSARRPAAPALEEGKTSRSASDLPIPPQARSRRFEAVRCWDVPTRLWGVLGHSRAPQTTERRACGYPTGQTVCEPVRRARPTSGPGWVIAVPLVGRG